MQKVKTLKELVPIVRKLKREGKTVVTTNGCFDILHTGHVRYLSEAKRQGDILIVGINSDKSVKMLKGEKRPIFPENERAELVAALDPVDYVFIFREQNPICFITVLKPDFHVKGGDYKIGQIIERKVVERGGGKVILTGKIKSLSTTDVVETILRKYKCEEDSCSVRRKRNDLKEFE